MNTMVLRQSALLVLLCVLSVAAAETCTKKSGKNKCHKTTSGDDCEVGTTCLEVSKWSRDKKSKTQDSSKEKKKSSEKSAKPNGICGPPQPVECPCDPQLFDAETCESGLTCRKMFLDDSKPKSKGPKCNYVCQLPTAAQQELQCNLEDPAKWEVVLDQTAGDASASALIDAIKAGAEVKVKTQYGLLNVQVVAIDEQVVYAQSLFYILPLNAFPFGDTYSMYFVLGSNRDVHFTSMYLGTARQDFTPPFQNHTLPNMPLKWFTRKRSNPVPNIEELSEAVKRSAASVRALWDNTVRQLDSVSIDDDGTVSGQSLHELRAYKQKAAFYYDEELELMRLNSLGTVDVIRVTLNSNETTGNLQDTDADITWFVDTCNKFVYRQDSDGKATSGRLQDLVQAVRSGSKVIIRLGETFHEASMVTVSGGDEFVQVQVYDSLCDDPAPTRCWYSVSTTGDVMMMLNAVGSEGSATVTTLKREVTWFVDKQPWTEQYHWDPSDNNADDSFDDLVAAINAGADVRVGINQGNQLDVFLADYVLVRPSYVTAYHDRQLQLDVDAYHRLYTFVQTGGNLRRMWYKKKAYDVETFDVGGTKMTWWTQ